MSIVHHPEISTLMSFAAGGLSEPFALVVASHAELCSHCRSELRRMHALGGAMMATGAEQGLQADAVERALRRVDAPEFRQRSAVAPAPSLTSGDALPGPLSRLVGGEMQAIAWRLVIPGAEDSRFAFAGRRGAQSLRFLRAEPGREIPEHSHVGGELTLVLWGTLRDGECVFAAGDVSDLGDVGTHSPVVVGDEPCVCVIAEEGPPRFVSPEMQALQRQIGI